MNEDLIIMNKTAIEQMEILAELLWEFYDYFHGGEKDYLLIILYVLITLIGVTANIFVIIMELSSLCDNKMIITASLAFALINIVTIIYNKVRQIRQASVTNYFVLNLSVADLLVATTSMTKMISEEISLSWNYGEFLCKLMSYLQAVSFTVSIYTIMAMSIDRYMAIRNPMILRYVCSRKNIILIIVIIWLTSMIFLIIIYVAMRTRTFIRSIINETLEFMPVKDFLHNNVSLLPPEFDLCMEDFSSLGIPLSFFGTVYLLVATVIPCVVVLGAYFMIGFTLCSKKPLLDCHNKESASSRQSDKLRHDRKRVALILLLLAIIFAICWLPYNIFQYMIDIDVINHTASNITILKYLLFLGHANSALNPIIFCWMARNFRKNLVKMLRNISSKMSRNSSSQTNTTTIISDNIRYIPISLQRLSRMHNRSVLQQQKWHSFRNNTSRLHRHKDIELKNFCDVQNNQVDLLKDDKKNQQYKDTNEKTINYQESNLSTKYKQI